MFRRILPILLTIAYLLWTVPAGAQSSTPTDTPTPQPVAGPVYIVQPGEGLSSIASKFGVTLNDLIAANNITNPNNISVGARIIIPGLDGISGILNTRKIGYGETLIGLSRQNQIQEDLLRKLNHITSPTEIYVGANLIYLQKDNFTALSSRISLAKGETLLEAAVGAQSDPWTLATLNGLKGSWAALPGDVLYTGEAAPTASPTFNGMPLVFQSASVSPIQLKQGGTADIVVQAAPGATLAGALVDKPLHFFPSTDGKQVALQGVYALLSPGLYPLSLEVTLPDGSKQAFEQMVVIKDGHYPTDPLLTVNSETIDPVENETELKQLEGIVAPVTPSKIWQGGFLSPVLPQFSDCHPSYFGVRRNYVGNGTTQTYHSFHAGLDFCAQVGDPITATADGVVVFAGPLTTHGNTTIIDHGWGIYSMYCHQSKFNVQVGQQVKAGELIGLAGATGRVTGPHLHFEVWVNGVEVDPLDWLAAPYP